MSLRGEQAADEKHQLSLELAEQLEALGQFLEEWAARLEQRILKVSPPEDLEGHRFNIRRLSGTLTPLPPTAPLPSEQAHGPPPPMECIPPWQPRASGTDSETIMSTAVQMCRTGLELSDMRIPGVLGGPPTPRATLPALCPSPPPSHRPGTPPLTGAGKRTRTSSRTFQSLTAEPKVVQGRSMMQLYDLTSKFDKKVQNELRDAWRPCHDNTLYIIVHSKAFIGTCSVLILLNASLIGVQMNSEVMSAVAKTKSEGAVVAWFVVEIMFAVIFTVELLLRAVSEKNEFWTGSEWKWNLFDLILVILSLVDIGMNQASTNLPGVALTRTLRVVRFARILRIIRVMRFFQSVRLMVYSILASLASLLWVFLLLFVVMYFFASIFIHGVTEHFKHPAHNIPSSDGLKELFGTLPTSLLSLFSAISGGRDWVDLLIPLVELHMFYGATFVMYIFFMVFGVLNVVVGTFVDSAYQVSQRDREYVVQCEVERNKKYMEDIKTFFYEADSDRSGMLTLEEFETHLTHDKVKAYFQALELDISQARALFMLLDVDGSNEIELEEFIGGCMRMKGDAKSIDVNLLLFENEKMIGKWTQFMDYCAEKFDRIEAVLGISSRIPLSQTDPPRCEDFRRNLIAPCGEGQGRLSSAFAVE